MRPGPDGAPPVVDRRTSATPASTELAARLRDWPGAIDAVAVARRRRPAARRLRPRHRGASSPPRPGRPRVLLGRVDRGRARRDGDRDPRPRRAARPAAGPAARRPGRTTPRTPSASRPRRARLGLPPDRDRRRPRVVRGRRPAPGAQGRGRRRRGLRRLRPPPDGDPGDARRRPPARAGPARLGRLRAADVPPDRGPARRLRRRPGRGRRGRDRRHLGRPRPGHDDRLGRAGWPRRSRRGGRTSSVAAPGIGRGDGRWLAGEVRPGDVVLVMGGGRSYRIGEVLLEELARRG